MTIILKKLSLLCYCSVSLWLIFAAVLANADDVVQTENARIILQNIIDPPYDSAEANTWLGADVAASIGLSPNKYVWIFGDTLLGTISHQSRHIDQMSHNTIGIMLCDSPYKTCGTVQKYPQGNDTFFVLNNKAQYYWPTAGSKLLSKLFLTGYVINNAADPKNWIDIAGTGFILIDNPTEDPSRWTYHIDTILNTDAHLNWATAAVVQDTWLYIFGSQEVNDGSHTSNTVLSRIRLTSAESGHWSDIEYWLGEDRWQKNLLSSSESLGKVPGLPEESEMSFGHNKTLGWYTVQIPVWSFDVHLYTAQALTGPWVDQGVIYTIPSPWNPADNPDPTSSFFIYAAKVHPELSQTDAEIVFTYNVNQMDPQGLISNVAKPQYWGLYVPQFVVMRVSDVLTNAH